MGGGPRHQPGEAGAGGGRRVFGRQGRRPLRPETGRHRGARRCAQALCRRESSRCRRRRHGNAGREDRADEGIQPLGMGPGAPVTGALFHAGPVRRRRFFLSQAGPGRRPGFHLQAHGGAGNLARRFTAGNGGAGHRAPGKEAAGDAVSGQRALVHKGRRDHHLRHPEGFDRTEGSPGRLVPGAQENRRYAQHACRTA